MHSLKITINDEITWPTYEIICTGTPDAPCRRPLLYECRHTAATLLMAAGADETTLTSIVGHSKITSTKAYLHTDESRKLAALESVSTQLGVI